jgi:heme/copper-type cytochrome/quinol oxidase subunit 2
MTKGHQNPQHTTASTGICGICIPALCFFLAAAHAQGASPATQQAAIPAAGQSQPQGQLQPQPQSQTQTQPQPEARLIEVLADHDSRFKVAGQEKAVMNLTAGEEIRLRITAVKAKNRNRDGSIHGFTLLHAKNRAVVPGWDFLLQPGVQEFLVTAPAEPGEYQVVCTVICSSGHEQMNMRVLVVSNGG